jgi:uncharacterized protein (DUF305 family)
MTHRARFTAALGASGLAGVVIAALIAAIQFSAHPGTAMGASYDRMAAPLCRAPFAAAEPDFYSDVADVNARMHQAMEVAPSDDIDRDFIRMMVPHHQGAIDMARVLLKYGRDERLKRLAQSIIVEQGQEIAYMRTLEAATSAEASAGDHVGDH